MQSVTAASAWPGYVTAPLIERTPRKNASRSTVSKHRRCGEKAFASAAVKYPPRRIALDPRAPAVRARPYTAWF